MGAWSSTKLLWLIIGFFGINLQPGTEQLVDSRFVQSVQPDQMARCAGFFENPQRHLRKDFLADADKPKLIEPLDGPNNQLNKLIGNELRAASRSFSASSLLMV